MARGERRQEKGREVWTGWVIRFSGTIGRRQRGVYDFGGPIKGSNVVMKKDKTGV